MQRNKSLAFLTPPRRHSSIAPVYRTILFDKRSNEDSDLQSIYDQVQQEDSEWYNSLSALLGDNVAAADSNDVNPTNKDDVGSSYGEYGIVDKGTSSDVSMTPNDESTLVVVDEGPLNLNEELQSDVKQSSDDERIIQSKELQARRDETRNQSLNITVITKEEDSSYVKNEETQPNGTTRKAVAFTSQSIQLRNQYTNQNEIIAPISYFIERGYTQNEVVSLRPRVLELIVQDDIPKPRRGIPDRWVRESFEDLDEDDVDWIVEITDASSLDQRDERGDTAKDDSCISDRQRSPEYGTKKSKSQSADSPVSEFRESSSSSGVMDNQREAALDNEIQNNTGNDIGTGDAARQNSKEYAPKSDYDVTPNRRRQTASQYRVSLHDEEKDRPRSRYPRQNSEQRQPRPRRKRELVINREEDDNDPPPNKFWMDLPTFRDFLRTEARLRLKILGPDWKESVLDESRWRFDLYKKWLYLLYDGVGENPLYTYGGRPRQPRPRLSRKERKYEASSMTERTTRGRSRNSSAGTRKASQRQQNYGFNNERNELQQTSVKRNSRDDSAKQVANDALNDYNDVSLRKNRTGEINDESKEHRQRFHVDHQRTREDYLETKDDEPVNDDGMSGRRKSREDLDSPRLRRRGRVRSPNWTDFGDLEDQLINGSRGDDRVNSSDVPRRRSRIFDDIDEDY